MSSQVCIPLDRDRNVWRIMPTKAGKGQFGSVWLACRETDCSYVMKIVPLKKGYGLRSFQREVSAQRQLAKLGLALEVVDSWVCENPRVGVIIMKVLDLTADAFFTQMNTSTPDQEALITSIINLVRQTHQSGFFHGDLHLGNIMLKKVPKSSKGPLIAKTSKGTFRVYLVDMGRAGALKYPGKRHSAKSRRKGDWYLLERELGAYARKGYPKFESLFQAQLKE